MKTKRSSKLFFLLIILMLNGCSESLDDKMYRIVDENYKTKKCEINFGNIITEKWEHIFIVEEYLTPSDISKSVGFKYSGEMVADGEYRLIITNKNQVLKEHSFYEPRLVFNHGDGTGITKIGINDTFCAEYNTSIKPNFYFLKKKIM